MPQIWEVTLGDEGVGARQEIGLKPPKGPARPWEVGALEPGGLGPVGDPIEGSPPGSPVPGILQARTLEWVAMSFSNA